MEKALQVGDVVTYTDPVGADHNALVTAVWGPTCINVLFVSGDGAKTDQYGRQMQRETSVGRSGESGTVHGRCYRLPGDAKPKYVPPTAV